MIGFPLPGTTPSTAPEPGSAALGEAAPADLFATLLAGLAPTLDAGETVQSLDTEGEAERDGPREEDSEGRQEAGLTLHAWLSGSLAPRLERATAVEVPRSELAPPPPLDLSHGPSTVALEPSVVEVTQPERGGLQSAPTGETDPVVADLPSDTAGSEARADGSMPRDSQSRPEAGGGRSGVSARTARMADAVETSPRPSAGATPTAFRVPPSVDGPAEPSMPVPSSPDPAASSGASSTTQVLSAATTSTPKTDSPQVPIPVDLVDRVIRAVELQRSQPPPRAVAVELPELEGLRIVVSLRLDGTIHISPVVPSGTTSPASAFVDAVSDALVENGFQLAGDTASDRRRRGNTDPERSQPEPRSTRPRTRTRHTSNDLRL